MYSEGFSSRREESQQRRALNRERSAEVLKGAGLSYESKNGGAHLIITHEGHICDLWPGTGKWQVRGGIGGRGVFNLLHLLRVNPKQPLA